MEGDRKEEGRGKRCVGAAGGPDEGGYSSLSSLPPISILLLSFLLIPASCSRSPLNSALHPFTHYPLHLSFTLLLFSVSPSIIHTHGAPGLWLSAVAPVAIIILEALSDYSFQRQRIGQQAKKQKQEHECNKYIYIYIYMS